MPAASPFTADHFTNRELSWLAFNERALHEAAGPGLPALEKAKFLAIRYRKLGIDDGVGNAECTWRAAEMWQRD